MTEVAGTPSVGREVAGTDTLSELEFGRALELVARRAVSSLGADAIRRRRPHTSPQWIEHELAMVAELAAVRRSGEAFEPAPVPDLSSTLRSLATPGGVLEPAALAELARGLDAMRRTRAGLRRLGSGAPLVAAIAVEIPGPELHRALERALEPDGTIKDDASRELRTARKRIRELRGRLVEALQRIARGLGGGGTAEDAGVTVRGGRYVIPVRRDARSRIQGIVHDESSSGATLFVEPVAVVELGNALRSAEAQEARAVHAIMRELTALARAEVDHLEAGWKMCIQADDVHARAEYMADVDAHVPRVSPAPTVLSIRHGFHPLILDEAREPVPFDLTMAAERRTLLVSGPNAGGKTVLLKAVALINALAQSGIVPPVGPETALPIFQQIFADIGDHQSIAESLSTFSAHVSTLGHILHEADNRSLVLLDEVGAGTDPFEGAALAGAVLLTLTARGSVTIATTHLSQLKDLAAGRGGFLNASLQFDAAMLTPTYRLLLGQPGRSYGLAIARRLGFPAEVLATAEELVPEGAQSLEAALADVEAAEAEVRRREEGVTVAEARLEAATQKARAEREEVDGKLEELQARELEIERRGREQARRFLLEARRRVEDALAVARAAVNEATAKEARRLVEEGVREEGEALKELEGKGWRLKAKRPAKGRAEPDVATTIKPGARAARPDVVVVPETASSEVDLRGMTGEEAEAAVLAAMDEAVMADLPWLRIIHGKGTGVLRTTVAQVLKRDGRVARFQLAPPQEGGSGVTIAEFHA